MMIRFDNMPCISNNFGNWDIDKYFALEKSEGFKSIDAMFAYLEEYAGDLKESKPFRLIEFEWEGKDGE